MNVLKIKKQLCLLFAFCAAVPTPARAMDDGIKTGLAIIGATTIIVAGVVLYRFLPYSCAGCDHTISKSEPFLEGTYCMHRFHLRCYNPNVICRYCEQNAQTAREISRALNEANEADKIRLRIEQERLSQERDKVKRQEDSDARLAQQEQLLEARVAGFRGQAYEAARIQQEALDRIQQEQRAKNEAARVQREAQEKARRQAEADARYARDLQIKEQQAADFKKEQERLQAIGWMVKPCPICHRALAQLSSTSSTLYDLRKSEHAQKIEALSCEHVCHTECIRKNPAYSTMCPECKATADSRRTTNTTLPSAPTQAQIQAGEQEMIRNTQWMMQECGICLDPLALKDGHLINLKNRENAHYIVFLPCTHAYHRHCIKENSQHSNRCPECRTEYNVRDL